MNHMAAQTAALSQIRTNLTAVDNLLRRIEDIFGLHDDDDAGSTPEDDILADFDNDEPADDIP